MTTLCHASTLDTPLGRFSIGVDLHDRLIATAFGDVDALARRLPHANLEPEPSSGAAARAQVTEYFAGMRSRFDLVLAPEGSAFQRQVWDELGRIPYGETRSYGDIARVLNSSARAVGRANATNPVCLIVPCHRVVGADGSLTGFAFGEEVKRWLLAFEQRQCVAGLSPRRGAA